MNVGNQLFITLLIIFITPSWRLIRNRTDASLQGNQRADAIWYFSGVPVVRIEEKQFNSESYTAWAELKQKVTKWTPAVFNRLQWILALAVAGEGVEVGFYRPLNDGNGGVELVHLENFDMGSIDSRVKLVHLF